MEELLTSFFDVFLFPVNPEYLDFENNPVMLLLCMILIGMGVFGLFMRVFYAFFNYN